MNSSPIGHELRPATGKRVLSARAAQQDIIDILSYMRTHYNVDPTRIYLAGYSMGGMTSLVTGARLADTFAAVVTTAARRTWLNGTTRWPPALTRPITPLAANIQTETGTYSELKPSAGAKAVLRPIIPSNTNAGPR